MSAPIDVSVLITAWGAHADLLPATLRSIADQHRAGVALDVHILDNAHGQPLPVPVDLGVPITIHRVSERLSTGAARNEVARYATSDLLCFADADDLMLPGFLTEALAALRDRRVVLAYAPLARCDGATMQRLDTCWPNPSRWRWITDRSRHLLAAACLLANQIPITGGAVVRREVFEAIGGFADTPVDDDWTVSPLIPLYGKVHASTVPGIAYRVYPTSLSRSPRPAGDYRRARHMVRSRFAACPKAPWWTPVLIWHARRRHEQTLPR